MNTEVQIWLEPIVANHKRCEKKKVYFKVVVDGEQEINEIDHLIQDVMDFDDIEINGDFGLIATCLTTDEVGISYDESPERKEANKRIVKAVESKAPIPVADKEVEIEEDGTIAVNIPNLMVRETIDFPKIWQILEKNILGKLIEGDKILITDDDGNPIINIMGGGFLNIGLAHLKIYDRKKRGTEPRSSFDDEGIKGGLYLRENGRLAIGDIKRTFYAEVEIGALLKQSLKSNIALIDIFQSKLLTNVPEKKATKNPKRTNKTK